MSGDGKGTLGGVRMGPKAVKALLNEAARVGETYRAWSFAEAVVRADLNWLRCGAVTPLDFLYSCVKDSPPEDVDGWHEYCEALADHL